MRITTITTCLLLLGTGGCTDEADMGIESDPVTCAAGANGAVAEVAGSVRYEGATYAFDDVYPSAVYDANGGLLGVSLWASENPDTQVGNALRLDFVCGAPQRGTYDVANVTDERDQLACPFAVAGSVTGAIEYLPASGGRVIIDDTEGCVAGRFRVDLSGFGSVGGWFSIPTSR